MAKQVPPKYEIRLVDRHFRSKDAKEKLDRSGVFKFRVRVWLTLQDGTNQVWYLPAGYRIKGGKPANSLIEALDMLFDFLADFVPSGTIDGAEIIYETEDDISTRVYSIEPKNPEP